MMHASTSQTWAFMITYWVTLSWSAIVWPCNSITLISPLQVVLHCIRQQMYCKTTDHTVQSTKMPIKCLSMNFSYTVRVNRDTCITIQKPRKHCRPEGRCLFPLYFEKQHSETQDCTSSLLKFLHPCFNQKEPNPVDIICEMFLTAWCTFSHALQQQAINTQ